MQADEQVYPPVNVSQSGHKETSAIPVIDEKRAEHVYGDTDIYKHSESFSRGAEAMPYNFDNTNVIAQSVSIAGVASNYVPSNSPPVIDNDAPRLDGIETDCDSGNAEESDDSSHSSRDSANQPLLTT